MVVWDGDVGGGVGGVGGWWYMGGGVDYSVEYRVGDSVGDVACGNVRGGVSAGA